MNEAIEDGVGERRLADQRMPFVDWDLAGRLDVGIGGRLRSEYVPGQALRCFAKRRLEGRMALIQPFFRGYAKGLRPEPLVGNDQG